MPDTLTPLPRDLPLYRDVLPIYGLPPAPASHIAPSKEIT